MGEGPEGVTVGEGVGGQKARTMVWVSTTTHPPLPPTLSTPIPPSTKNLLHFYEKQRGLGGVRRVGGPRSPTGIRPTRWTRGST